MTIRFFLGLALLLAASAKAEKPNVILMMADDLGYGDLSCYGSEKLRTPVLDQLARDGVRLTSYYAGATVCTPSRMALLTGAYPPRLGWTGGVIGYRIQRDNGLAPEARTMADVFKTAGYATTLIGKWHLGDSAELHPLRQGFDSAYFIDKSNNQTKKLWRDEELVADPFDNRRLTQQFITEAIRFVEANREKPFFLYLPFTAPHFPAQAHPDWKDKSKNHAYGDVVEEMDARIGDLLAAVRKAGLDQKTIVVFTSDNGPEPGQKKWATAKPYRGLKWSALEGGTRVPCIVRLPGVIPEGLENDHLVSAIDLLPTLAHACGIELSPAAPGIDGVNAWSTVTGQAGGPPRNSLLYWHGWATPQAIRAGNWKLFFDRTKEIPATQTGPALFNLAEDPAEENNLSDQHPEKVKELLALAAKQLKDIEEKTLPLGGKPVAKAGKPKRGAWLKNY